MKPCPLGLCDGSGYIHVQRGDVSAVKPCQCRPAAPQQEDPPKRSGLQRVDGKVLAGGGK